MVSVTDRSNIDEYNRLDLSNPYVLLATLKKLRQSIDEEGQAILKQWQIRIQQPEFLRSARNQLEDFFEGDHLLEKHTEALFGRTVGKTNNQRRVRIMVTLPTEGATDYEFVRSLIQQGANCVRINCS